MAVCLPRLAGASLDEQGSNSAHLWTRKDQIQRMAGQQVSSNWSKRLSQHQSPGCTLNLFLPLAICV